MDSLSLFLYGVIANVPEGTQQQSEQIPFAIGGFVISAIGTYFLGITHHWQVGIIAVCTIIGFCLGAN